MYTHIIMYVYINIYMCIYICIYVCTYTNIHVCMYSCVYMSDCSLPTRRVHVLLMMCMHLRSFVSVIYSMCSPSRVRDSRIGDSYKWFVGHIVCDSHADTYVYNDVHVIICM